MYAAQPRILTSCNDKAKCYYLCCWDLDSNDDALWANIVLMRLDAVLAIAKANLT